MHTKFETWWREIGQFLGPAAECHSPIDDCGVCKDFKAVAKVTFEARDADWLEIQAPLEEFASGVKAITQRAETAHKLIEEIKDKIAEVDSAPKYCD